MKIGVITVPKSQYRELWRKSISKIILHLRVVRIMKEKKLLEDKNFTEYIIERSTRLLRGKTQIHIPPCILLPDGRFREYWNLLIGILLIYTALITPFTISFMDITSGDWIFEMDLVVDICFLADTALNFFTAYYNKDNILIYNRCKIAKNYLKHNFFLDLLASFPFTLTDLTSKGYSYILRIVRLRALSKLLKLSRLFKMFTQGHNSLLKELQVYLCISHSFARLIKLLGILIICIHLAACMWHWIAGFDNFGPGTWVFETGNTNSPIYRRYIISLYWALTTLSTIGYGEIHPYSDNEKIVAIVWMSFALFVLSFSISSLSSMLSQIDYKKTVLRNKMTFIDEFSKEVKLSKKVKKELQQKLLDNIDRFNYSYNDRMGLVSQFPKELKLEIAYTMHKGHASRLEAFAYEDDNLLLEILPLLQHLSLQGLQTIYSTGECSTKIYFIIRGRVNFLLANETSVFQVYGDGGYFGDIEFMLNTPRMNTAVSATECVLLIMSTDILKKINDFFPSFFKKLKSDAKKRNRKNLRARAEMKLLIEMNHSDVIGKIHPLKVKEMVNRETVHMARRESAFHIKDTENLSIFNSIMQTTDMIDECKKSLSEVSEIISMLSLK